MPLQFRLPKDIPLDEYPKPEAYLDEGLRLSDDAQKQGLILRVMGPIALHYYFPEYVDLYRRMERLGERVFTDIDFAAYGKHRGKLVPFFEAHGYELEKRAAMISGGTRMIFFSANIPMIDVFFDKLDYNHPIDYRNRLEAHPHCVSLADLMLQKLQIVQINDKDLKDAMLLLLATVFFSGFFMRLETLAEPVRVISWLLPGTYGILLLQDIMLRGTLNDPTLLYALALIGAFLFFLSLLLLRRRMARS